MLMVKIPVFLVLLIALLGIIEESYPKSDDTPIFPSFVDDIMFVNAKEELPTPRILGVIYLSNQNGVNYIWNGNEYMQVFWV